MNAHLPTILTLSASKSSEERGHATDHIDRAMLESRLAEALLGDATLTAHDLPATWSEAEPGASMLAGTDYEAVALGDVRRAFEDPRSGRRIEQQVAVLPRWAARQLPGGPSTRPGATAAFDDHQGGGVQLLVRPAVGECTAEVVQFGTVVMALRYDDLRGGELPAALRETAYARCRELAQTLR